jgi:hypothetical protein
MDDFYTLDGKSMDKYYQTIDSLHHAPEKMEILAARSFYDDLIKRCKFDDLKEKADLKNIKATYLIQRIDHAFDAWQTPWAKNLDFEDFCEFLLPYRVGTEVLEPWEYDYKNYFQFAFDNIDYESDSALYYICDNISNRYKVHSYDYPLTMPSIKPSVLKYQQIGPCYDFANMFIYIGRTFGIPVAIDFTPQWANHANGHIWSSAIYNGKSLDFMIGEKGSLNGHLKKFSYKMVKVFRKTYGIQENSLAVQASGETLPHLFQNSRIKDVTKEYIPVIDLHIEDLTPAKKGEKRVYLSVFNNKNWVPVAWGELQGNEATIYDIGYEAVFLPVYYNRRYVPAQYPIKVDAKGNSQYLKPDKKNLRSVILKRKYMDFRAMQFVEFLKDGKFQLADNELFENCKEFYIPDTVGYNYQTFNVNDNCKYKYIRYVPRPGSNGNISEIEIYNKNNSQITGGRIFGTYSYAADTLHRMEKVFDGNVLSYAICDITRTDQWIGLELEEPIEISKILYLPRSDDNFIKDGNEYELFYWENSWISLGKQTGKKQSQILIYDNVPDNVLLLLRNHTKGKEERIFTYEDNKQIWW